MSFFNNFQHRQQLFLTLGIATLASLVIVKFSKWYLRNRQSKSYRPVFICNNLSDWKEHKQEFMKGLYSSSFVGLDCEWVTVHEKRQPVALLQLATADGLIILIRLCKMSPGLIPVSLIEYLADKRIVKVGVGICADADKLLVDYGLIVESCLDLRHIALNLPDFEGHNGLSLQTLAQVILEADLKKSEHLTCSDWEADVLNSEQVAYAAEDALAAAQIFRKILKSSSSKKFFCNFNDELENYKHFFNVPYKYIRRPLKQNVSAAKTNNNKKRIENHEKVRKLCRSIACVKRAPYENCQLQAPDGEQLCVCDSRKALWYVQKGRGDIINEDPLIVKLNFEPSGRPILDNKFYIQEKSNSCVVCGKTEYLFRKFVVPSEYRKYFPELMKKSLSHDVVLLCAFCHRKSNILDEAFREQLARECNIVLKSESTKKKIADLKLVKVKGIAKALLNFREKIPEQRRLELYKHLQDYYNVDHVTDDMIETAANLGYLVENEDYMVYSKEIYEHFCKNEGLIALESKWRKHFLDTMKPKFLPNMWSVDHNHQRLAILILKKKVHFDVSILGLSDELMNDAKNIISGHKTVTHNSHTDVARTYSYNA